MSPSVGFRLVVSPFISACRHLQLPDMLDAFVTARFLSSIVSAGRFVCAFFKFELPHLRRRRRDAKNFLFFILYPAVAAANGTARQFTGPVGK